MIGLFNDCFLPIIDGVSMTVYNYAHWLDKMGKDVCVVTPYVPDAKDDYHYQVHRYMSMPIPTRKPYRLGFPELDRSFSRVMNNTSFSLVHAHSPFSSGDVALKISRQQKIPIIATFHSKFRDDFKRIFRNDIIVQQLINKIIDFYKQADQVWIPQAEVEQTIREYGYHGPVEIVDNGNDFSGTPYNEQLKREARESLGITDSRPILLFVGQHIWEKNISLILKSLERLGNHTFKMFFVGTGYAEEDIKHLAQELGLSSRIPDEMKDKVLFVGTVSERETMRKFYLASDLFLFPSLYDNAPLVVREAAAMHVPSLMVRNSTASRILSDGINGFLASNDIDDYSKALSKLLDQPSVISKVGDQASISLSRPWKDIVNEVHERYTDLIAHNQQQFNVG